MKKKLGAALLLLPVIACGLPAEGGKPEGVPANLTKTIQFEVTVDIEADHEVQGDGYVNFGTTGQVLLNAIPDDPRVFGGRSDGGQYPLSASVQLPWEHTIYYEPPLKVTAQLTVSYVGLYEGESVTCVVRVNGDEVDRKVYSSHLAGSHEEGSNPDMATIACGTGGPV